MARARRVNLDDLHARLAGDRRRVHRRIEIGFDHADRIIPFQPVDELGQQRRFSAARRGHDVEKKDLFFHHLPSDILCLFVIPRPDIFFYFYDF